MHWIFWKKEPDTSKKCVFTDVSEELDDAKRPDQSLEEIIKTRHLNPWCKLEKWFANKSFEWTQGTGYYIVDWIKDSEANEVRFVKCFPDDEDNYSVAWEAHIQFFESANDKRRYYKVRFQDSPSIFWKIESL